MNKIKIASRKLVASADEAVRVIRPGQTVISGGFGLAGVPFSLIKAIARNPQIKDLTVVSNTAGTPEHGLSLLIKSKQARKMIFSYVGENPLLEKAYLNGELELELVPQGTLAERIRAAGMGISVFSTPTGVGTLVETGGFITKYTKDKRPEKHSEPKQTIKCPISGRKLLLEPMIKGDIGLVKASIADESGNLIFNKSTANFNPDLAKGSKFVIAEVEKIVPNGSLDPNTVHVSGIFVDMLVLTEEKSKPFEKIINTKVIADAAANNQSKDLHRQKIARRAAKDIFDTAKLNLGIGIPTLIPSFVPSNYELNIHAENGIMGVAGYPEPGQEDPDLINPGKETITVHKNASFFSSSESFGMVRGGHLDFTFLGTMQVDEGGSLASWVIPGKFLKGMGGSMDLVASGKPVTVCTEHIDKNHKPKILKKCSFPLTGKECVSKIVTNMAVFEVKPEGKGLKLLEIADDTTLQKVIDNTEPEFEVASDLKRF